VIHYIYTAQIENREDVQVMLRIDEFLRFRENNEYERVLPFGLSWAKVSHGPHAFKMSGKWQVIRLLPEVSDFGDFSHR